MRSPPVEKLLLGFYTIESAVDNILGELTVDVSEYGVQDRAKRTALK
jgi:hypothetical protein